MVCFLAFVGFFGFKWRKCGGTTVVMWQRLVSAAICCCIRVFYPVMMMAATWHGNSGCNRSGTEPCFVDYGDDDFEFEPFFFTFFLQMWFIHHA
ncbi:hypothetical protein HanRHA438_Chr04g0158801 [Helianthus annuus]|nr:hypothetical protein HanRHA438_Chr04g0158801 [Helianthus annuus]